MVLASQTKTPSIHHRKRNGQHHKTSKAYHKTYWPYLPIVLILGLGIGVNSLWDHASHGVLGYATDMSATELLVDTNAQRANYNEAALNLNAELDNAAQAKANNMVALNYWSHDTPSGQPPWVFITSAGYHYVIAGENLAYGFNTSQNVITAWIGSPEHRANVLNGNYKDVGFGIANATNFQHSGPETIVVAEYGDPASGSAATTTTQQTTPVALNATPVSRLQLIGDDTTTTSTTAAITALAILCFVAILVRHGLIWRRVLRKGEEFTVRYHLLDIIFVTVGVIGFIVTRSAGFIH